MNINKNDALKVAERMTNGDIQYFMSNYPYDNKSNSKEWHNRFVEYIKNEYIGTEKTFMEVVNVFNKYYWYSYINGK